MKALSNLSPEQELEVRAALLARLQQQLAGMETCDIRSLVRYADIADANHGCDTPAEEFITRLVLRHHVRALTPEDAADYLEEFRRDFDFMVEGVRAFSARYPEAVKSAA